MCKAKRPLRLISMIHKARMVNTRRKDRKTKLETKKPYILPSSERNSEEGGGVVSCEM
jgi:hypothetical protein